MNHYEAHVTDDYTRDSMVIQVREKAANGATRAIGQVLEDADGVPTLMFKARTPEQFQDDEVWKDPTPGIRVRHDAAVAIARAILTEAGKDADEVERLKGERDTVVADNAALATAVQVADLQVSDLTRQVEMLERLLEAKDAHLEREARTADHFHESLEKDRRQGDEMRQTFMDHLTGDGGPYAGVKVKRSDLGPQESWETRGEG